MIRKYIHEFDDPEKYPLSVVENKLLMSKITTRFLALLIAVLLLFLVLAVHQTNNEIRTLSQNLAKPTRYVSTDADAIRKVQNGMDVANQKLDNVVGYVRPTEVGK